MKIIKDNGHLEFALEHEDLATIHRVQDIMFQLRLYNPMSEELRQRSKDADVLLEELIKICKVQ